MGRRRRESPAEGFLSDVFELCSLGPIWVGPLIAAIVFGIFFFLIPWFLADRVGNDLAAQMSKLPNGIFRNLSRFMSLPITAIILMVWGIAEFKKLARRRMSAAEVPDAPATRQRQPAEQSNTCQTPTCPRCGASMVMRTAKRGVEAGSRFWGCSNFAAKKCQGTRQVS
ncbi:MAG: hypothetical protein K8T91_16385 [Planctomycetes bacterium]|nr:hypothetical protein [Planctomycetota bacterium]